MKINARRFPGFTLVEMLLVMVIISVIVVMGVGYLQQRTMATRIDRATMQMQQILNAGLSYYVANGFWPSSLPCLQGINLSGETPDNCTVTYLPTSLISPWGTKYAVVSNSSPSSTLSPALMYVFMRVTSEGGNADAIANTIMGRLPLAYASNAAGNVSAPPANDNSCAVGSAQTQCNVVSSINIPGQNLNNASAINFAGLYHSGACVPVPKCPVDKNGVTMTPEIIVAPVSINGVYDAPTTAPGGTCTATDMSGCQANIYPINSFAAYTTEKASRPNGCDLDNPVPRTCVQQPSPLTHLPTSQGEEYWRVCLSTVTERGKVNPTTNPWGQIQGTILAVTRCSITNEPSGSNFQVWTP